MFRWNFFGTEAVGREEEALLLDDYDDLDRHADAGEEPLLADAVDPDDTDLEVVVEKHPADIEITCPDRPPVHSLYDKIQACIVMLEAARVNAEHTVIEQTHQKYVNAALLIGGSALAVISPSILISFLIRHWYEVYQQLEHSFRDQLDVLVDMRTENMGIYDAIFEKKGKILTGVIAKQIHEWFDVKRNQIYYDQVTKEPLQYFDGTCQAFHENGGYECDDWIYTNKGPRCLYPDSSDDKILKPGEIYNSFCNIAHWKIHAFDGCIEVAERGCETLNNFTQTDSGIGQLQVEMLRAMKNDTNIVVEIERVNSCYNAPFKCEDTGGIIGSAIAQGLLIGASAFAIAVLLKRAKTKSGEYKHKMAHRFDVEVCVTNPEHANAIMSVAERLGINMVEGIKGITVDELIEQLRSHANDINDRWRARTAFLGGKLKPEAYSYSFFNNPGSKDIKKRIMQYAELLPQHAIRK